MFSPQCMLCLAISHAGLCCSRHTPQVTCPNGYACLLPSHFSADVPVTQHVPVHAMWCLTVVPNVGTKRASQCRGARQSAQYVGSSCQQCTAGSWRGPQHQQQPAAEVCSNGVASRTDSFLLCCHAAYHDRKARETGWNAGCGQGSCQLC